MKPRFDGQPLIDAYGDGGFRLAEQRFEGSIMVTPLALSPWQPAAFTEATAASLAPLIDARHSFDFLLFGTGEAFVPLPPALRRHLESLGLMSDFMPTGAACRTYNLMLSENRRVAAALIAVA